MVTAITPLPENITKLFRCRFIHETARVMIGNEIKEICLTCTKEKMKEKRKEKIHKDAAQDKVLIKKEMKKEIPKIKSKGCK